tara:strand:+ start:243 stop:2885 length:2643 start_codon:yes stop_codon:yes gene_type:complete
MAEDKLITKNDLEKSIRDIAKEVKQSYEKGQTHSIFIQNLLDNLEKKSFDINNPDNIKRLDNFALTNEFLNFQDLIDSDEIAPVSAIPVAAKGEEGLLETYSLSNLDDNLQIIDTPTNVVDDVVIGIDRSGKEATVLVNENGYVELFRATDNPERLVISDFTKQGDIQSAGLGTQNYFATNAPYANKYTGTNKKLYKFSTNIKPNEILDISPVSLKNKHPELYTLIFGENEIRNTKAIQDNIETIKELGYKAIGNRETGSTGLLEVAQYEIIPLTTANETYNIKPIATLQTKEGFAAGKSPEAFIETLLDTPTNVVDDVIKNKGTINEYINEAFNKYELNNNLLQYNDLEDFLINNKNLKPETAKKIIDDIKIGVTSVEFPSNKPGLQGGISKNYAKETGLLDVGISKSIYDGGGVQNYLDSIYTTPSTLSNQMSNMTGADRRLLQNTFFNTLQNSNDVVEIYLRQVSKVNVPAESVYFRPELVQEVPGFYTEPIGGLSPGDMASGGGIAATENYYRLEVNKNNLLIGLPGYDFANELKTKLNWNLLEKELGITYSMFDNINSYQTFHTVLNNKAQELGIDNTKLYSSLRKSGYEGTVGYTNRQVEVILLDPNDDLGIGKKVNFENSTTDEFYNNKQTVNTLDELVIKPDTPGGSLGAAQLNDPLVFDSWVDNLGRTTASFVDNLPLQTVVKNRVKNLITTKTKQLAKPGSLLVKAVDAWEFAVIGLMAAGVAFNEIDEVPTIINNTTIDMFNSMTTPYGIPPVAKEEYDIDYEFINTVLDTGTKVMPTDIIIEKLKPYSLEEGEDVILPGTGVTAITGAEQQFEPYGEELAEGAEKTVNIKRDEVKQKLLESKGVQEEKMFEQAKPKKSSGAGSGVKIL